ncbi:MAG: hypothetical protein IT204_04605 [Fimbriimonadaceae bacterium]|nr:hypothetical protein [Fimbriimonadaceae bacterium]
MSTDPQTPSRSAELKAQTYGFDELPLEQFRGLSAAEIEAFGGIGPKSRQRIQEALAELDVLDPPPPPLAAPDAYLEPAAPGNGGPAVLLMVVLLLAILVAIVMFAGGNGNTRKLQADLNAAQAAADRANQAITTVQGNLVVEAAEQADWVFAKARDRNYGLALEHLNHVTRTLRALEGAAGAGGGPAEHGGHGPAGATAVQAALTAAGTVQATLLLEQPQTQAQIEAQIQALRLAVAALQGEPEKG